MKIKSDMRKFLFLFVVLTLMTSLSSAQEKKRFYKDKYWWIGEAVIAGSWLASGIAVNHTRYGATNIFGNDSTSAKIAGFETAIFAGYTGLNYMSWKFGHDDPKKGWRIFSYVGIPATSVAFGTATAVDALNSTPSAHAVPKVHCPKTLVCN
jgi:hypothetical protein